MTEHANHKGALAAGTLLGNRFRVECLIGRGGMGDVYAARHVTTGKEVALKIIRSTDRVWRFTREARAATAIVHPNVIEIYDLFEDASGTPIMVMELLRGETLAAYRERAGALTLQGVAQILGPVLDALRAVHAKGIVHRDMKPENIYLAESPAGRVPKILDFGIAKVLDPAKLGSDTHGQETNTAAVLGTYGYMSPEQAMSEPIDSRTDVWSAGVILFEALTGRRPIVFETIGQMYAAFFQGTVPTVRDFVPELPEDAATLIDRCLVKNKGERLDDLSPLIDVLAKYADGSVPGALAGGRVVGDSVAPLPPTHAPTSRTIPGPLLRRPRLVITAVTFATAAASVGLWAERHNPPPGPLPPGAFGSTTPGAAGQSVEPWLTASAASAETSMGPVSLESSLGPRPTVTPSPSHAGGGLAAVRSRADAQAATNGSAQTSGRHGIAVADPYDPDAR